MLRPEQDYTLHKGDDGETEYLVTTWADGTMEVAARPVGSGATWSAPASLLTEAVSS